ncbi:MAG TPA: hypothetical protein VHP83_15890 [Aggregatilineaceae bacterium]|nr:hypothetical protein [Aggregatilineaceae bacterium]
MKKVCFIFLLMLSLLPFPAQAQDSFQMVSPSGPYRIGRTAFQWVDESREEVHTEEEGDFRELLVEAWYPAAPTADAQFGPYMEPDMAALFAAQVGQPAETVSAILSNAYPDAPLADDLVTYPVVVFDPGFSPAPRQYSVIIEELASHGYVVFAVSHPYVTTVTVFPDGRVIEPINSNRLSTLWAPRDIYDGEFEDVWVPDTTFVLDQIEALNDSDPRFAGRLETSRIGMVGHSQGARTVSEVCLRDARCVAAVNLDGNRSAAVEFKLTKPYMLLLADNGVAAFANTYQFGLEAMASDFYVLMIPQTNHMSFEDSVFWVPVVSGTTDAAGVESAQIVLLDYREYIRAFCDQYVRDLTDPLLEGPSDSHPEVFFLRRDEPITPPTAAAEPQAAVLGGNTGELALGEADVWIYEGQAGEIIDFMLMADKPADGATVEQAAEYGLMDTLLVIRAPDGSILALNDDTGMSTNSTLEGIELPADGPYTIEVRTWESQTAGGYTLVLTAAE